MVVVYESTRLRRLKTPPAAAVAGILFAVAGWLPPSSHGPTGHSSAEGRFPPECERAREELAAFTHTG